jgi:hypothetical protein
LVQIINDMGNPFLDDNDKLLALDTRNVLDKYVVKTVLKVHLLGKDQDDQYDKYYKEVITDRTMPMHEPIKNNALPLFSCQRPKTKSKPSGQISSLKNDVALFSQLYIVIQYTEYRASDTGTFFSRENHDPFPPSLSDAGKLRLRIKSDLLNKLTKETQNDPLDFIDIMEVLLCTLSPLQT